MKDPKKVEDQWALSIFIRASLNDPLLPTVLGRGFASPRSKVSFCDDKWPATCQWLPP